MKQTKTNNFHNGNFRSVPILQLLCRKSDSKMRLFSSLTKTPRDPTVTPHMVGYYFSFQIHPPFERLTSRLFMHEITFYQICQNLNQWINDWAQMFKINCSLCGTKAVAMTVHLQQNSFLIKEYFWIYPHGYALYGVLEMELLCYNEGGIMKYWSALVNIFKLMQTLAFLRQLFYKYKSIKNLNVHRNVFISKLNV